MRTAPRSGLDRLRLLCGGAVHLPGDPGYGAACAGLGAHTPHPAAALYPGDEDEVAESLQVAAELGLRVLVQRTGLGPRPVGPLSDVLLLRTSGLGGVHPSADSLVARAGALCADVASSAAAAGIDLETGDPRHGVVGGTVLGPPGAATAVVAARAVLADGTIVVARRTDDLVRGLRTGILPAAVVTEMTLMPRRPEAGGGPDQRMDPSVIRDRLDPTGLFLLPG